MRLYGGNRNADGNAIAATTGRKKSVAQTIPTARAPRSVAGSTGNERSISGTRSLVRYWADVESGSASAPLGRHASAPRSERERFAGLRRDPLGIATRPRPDVSRPVGAWDPHDPRPDLRRAPPRRMDRDRGSAHLA